ncbi:MAG: amidohydrolase family protein, partial [Gemmatimonadales bacterium]|nr:amidohydrolase family protein [Gemmatimonadales bacterium]
GVLVLSVLDSTLRRYEGRRIADIAREEHHDPYEALFDLLAADRAKTGAAFFSMSEPDVRAAVSSPWVGVGSDFGATAPDGPLGLRKVHPRAYGTFPRILGRYVREERALTLEAAVRKMTGVAAERMGLPERGLLREGYFADITVFDAGTVMDRATFEDPSRPSEGIRYVMVNGRLTLDEGRVTGERPGRALRGPGWRRS